MQFIGFMVILVAAGLLVKAAMLAAGDAEILAGIAAYSPWIAAHAEVLGWVAAGVVFSAGLSVPPILLSRDAQDGQDRMGTIGDFAGAVSLGYVLIFMAIPGVGYLLGMGWFAAKKAAGF